MHRDAILLGRRRALSQACPPGEQLTKRPVIGGKVQACHSRSKAVGNPCGGARNLVYCRVWRVDRSLDRGSLTLTLMYLLARIEMNLNALSSGRLMKMKIMKARGATPLRPRKRKGFARS